MASMPEVVIEKQEDSRSLARIEGGGMMALALMSESEFGARLQALKKGQERVRTIQRELMVEDEDYGKIPGTDKPTLLKPGAEKLSNVYGLVPTFEETWVEGDGITTPHLRCRMRCYMRRGDERGPVAGAGVGAANSWEKKHRYRRAQRSCPACGTVGSIRKSKYADKRTGDIGWWCREEACKTNFESTDPAIVDQALGDVENPDPFDVENTLFKMAKKRAYVDATLNATATSGLFTQDMEDLPEAPEPRRATPTAPVPASREPGEEDAEIIETADGQPVKVGSGERAAQAGAKTNPGYDPAAQAPKRSATPAGGKAPCPQCGKPANPSKFPKAGSTFYCFQCKHPFDPSGARRA